MYTDIATRTARSLAHLPNPPRQLGLGATLWSGFHCSGVLASMDSACTKFSCSSSLTNVLTMRCR